MIELLLAQRTIPAEAGQDLIDCLNAVNVRTSINGAYNGIPKNQYTVHQAWSGDMAAAWFYVPKFTMAEYQNTCFLGAFLGTYRE